MEVRSVDFDYTNIEKNLVKQLWEKYTELKEAGMLSDKYIKVPVMHNIKIDGYCYQVHLSAYFKDTSSEHKDMEKAEGSGEVEIDYFIYFDLVGYDMQALTGWKIHVSLDQSCERYYRAVNELSAILMNYKVAFKVVRNKDISLTIGGHLEQAGKQFTAYHSNEWDMTTTIPMINQIHDKLTSIGIAHDPTWSEDKTAEKTMPNYGKYISYRCDYLPERGFLEDGEEKFADVIRTNNVNKGLPERYLSAEDALNLATQKGDSSISYAPFEIIRGNDPFVDLSLNNTATP